MAGENNGAPGGDAGATGNGGKIDLAPLKRGPGRPAIHGRYAGEKKKAGAPHAEKPEPRSEAATAIDAAFLADTVIALLEITDDVNRKSCMASIKKIAPLHAAEFDALWRDVGLNDKDKKMTYKAVEAIARKYTFLAKFAPEILLLVTITQFGLRQLRLRSFVADLEEKASKRKTPETKVTEVNRVQGEMPGPVSASP